MIFYLEPEDADSSMTVDLEQDMMFIQVDNPAGSGRIYLTKAEETELVLALIERKNK